MKTALPWVLVAALLAGGYFLFAAGQKKDAQIAALQQDNTQVSALREENEQLKKIPDQTAELERLRKDNEDLLRLRSEVSQFRQQTIQLSNQLQTAQLQRSQVQAQAQQQIQQTTAQLDALKNQAQQQAQVQAQAQANACIINLRQIQGAKQTWALDNRKAATAIPTAADLVPYFPNDGVRPNTFPVCPGGGTYIINAVNTPPTCSLPSHVLPRE